MMRSTCLLLAIMCFAEMCSNKNALRLGILSYFELAGEKTELNFKKEIPYTPHENIISRTKIHTKQSFDYNYFYCQKDIGKVDTALKNDCNVTYLNEYTPVLKTTHYVISNAYGSLYGSWAIGDSFVKLPRSSYELVHNWGDFTLKQGKLKYYVDEIILVGNSHANLRCFGHTLMDVFEPIFMLPEEIIQRSFIACTNVLGYVKELLIDLGIRESQLIMLGRNDWFYGKKVHVFSEYRPCVAFGGEMVNNFRIRFQKYYNTTSIIPTDYAIVNRCGNDRSMNNVKELIEAFKNNFPDIKWICVPDIIKSFRETALAYAKMRILFSIQGSNSFRGGFMQKNTVICVGLTQRLDIPTARFLACSEHFVFYFESGITKYSSKKEPVNIANAVESIRQCLKTDKQELWRSGSQ